MCFKDLAQRERELRIAGRGASLIREGARAAGLPNVEFLSIGTMRMRFNFLVNGPGVVIDNWIGQLHVLHHVSMSLSKRQRTHSTLRRSSLSVQEIVAQMVIIDVPGYEPELFNIPTTDLLLFRFCHSSSQTEGRVNYYLDGKDQDFPFEKYRNDWSPFENAILAA